MDRRGTDDPTGLGYFHDWAWSWPLNRRVLYNRASADADGQPWDPTRPGIELERLEPGSATSPTSPPTRRPTDGQGAFIMTGEGVGRLFAPGSADDATGRSPSTTSRPSRRSTTCSPASGATRRRSSTRAPPASFAEDDAEFPYVATTYRVTEHEHYVTQNVPYLVEAMPDFFVELPVELAEEKGIDNGGRVRVRSKRGEVEGVALVTKRMRPLRVGDGKVVYQVGIPRPLALRRRQGREREATPTMANLLTPYIGDANVRTPEFKGFLVNVERA